jgi:hypothetical protein
MPTRADLDLAERHVARGRQHVADQERIVTKLRGCGALSKTAEDLLEEFRATLEDHIAHCARIRTELGLD